jgi:hypothetical protein
VTTGSSFTIARVEWEYTRSKAMSGTPEPSPPHRSGIEALHATCRACGASWRATKSRRGPTPGRFYPGAGAVVLMCAECPESATIPNSDLPG